MIEVNRPEEIDALLAATAAHLKATGFPMQGRSLVYVSDDRKYKSGAQFERLAMEPHEASPYASVYKYSHNVLPARSALGARGCIDCHASGAAFFEGRSLQRPFDETGKSVWLANYQLIGLPSAQVKLGAVREGTLKPGLYLALCLLALAVLALAVRAVVGRLGTADSAKARQAGWWTAALGLCGLAATLAPPRLLSYMTFDRFTLDANHFWISAFVLGLAALMAVLPTGRAMQRMIQIVLGISVVSGALMLLNLWWISYTIFDAAVFMAALLLIVQAGRMLLSRREPLGVVR
jgi:hypothetical protein